MPVANQDFIAPRPTPIHIALEPAYNAIHSLVLINKAESHSGLSDWVVQTACSMTPNERNRHNVVMNGLYYAVQPERSWLSFPVYLEHLESLPPAKLRDKLLDTYARFQPDRSEECNLPMNGQAQVDYEPVLASPESFIAFLSERFHASAVIPEVERQAYAYIMDPPALKSLVITHLREMWERFLAKEWDRVQPMLQDSVRAFRQVDFSHLSVFEAAQLITGQELEDEHWQAKLGQASNVVFVPQAHIGPYLGTFRSGDTLGVFFGARLPRNTALLAPDLSRTEILVRLSALADDSRLQILKFIAENGEQRSQDIIQRLDLSQSAASRHLQQLSATGYLNERRCEGAKCYSINVKRIEDTLQATATFLNGSEVKESIVKGVQNG